MGRASLKQRASRARGAWRALPLSLQRRCVPTCGRTARKRRKLSASAGSSLRGIEDGPGRVAAYEQCRKDLPALSSWSDAEIEATFTYMQSTPSELLFNSPIGPFLVLSGLSIWRDGMAAWGIPPCKTYLDLCEALPTFQLNVMGS